MTGTQPGESWSYSSHNRAPQRDSPERRRQGRGRASFGRPTSVGSARFVTPSAPVMNHHAASQRSHTLVSPTAPTPTPHRSASPTPAATAAEASSSRNANSSFAGHPASNSAAVEEPSPSVVVGSGVGPSERSSSLGNAPQIPPTYFDNSTDGWYDMLQSQSGRTSLPSIASYRPRPMDNSSPLPPLFQEQLPDGFGGGLTASNFSQAGNVEGPREGTYGHAPTHRWSGQFLN